MSKRTLKQLWNDKRGSVLVIAGMAMPLMLGSVGLATDTIQWALWKRQLQRSADSAAMAGVYAISAGVESHTEAVDRDLATNQRTGIALSNKVVTTPTVTGFSDAVRVNLGVQKSLPFSSMFMTTAPTIRAEATAAISKEGNYCMKGLKNTTDPSIRINGNVTINMGCGIISNSTNPIAGITVDGNSHLVNATPIAAVGKVPTVNGTNVEMSYQLKQPDPFEGQYPTAIPSSAGTCKTLAQHMSGITNSAGYKVISPGCYKSQGSGANIQHAAFKTSNEKIALNPGTYYIDSADFDIGANSFIAVNSSDPTQGVTIILTGATPGMVSIGSNAEVKLRAPSSGPYSKMLFVQSANATSGSLIGGNSSSTFDGTFYFPNTTVDYNGGGTGTFQCAMIVGYVINLSGNSSIQNDTSACNASTQQTISRVRLVG